MGVDPVLVAARQIVSEGNRSLGTTRYLAAALLGRQALEGVLARFWAEVVPGLEACSARAQLVSLPFYLDSSELAGQVSYAWVRLSDACHYDAYELPPTYQELDQLLAIIDQFARGNRGDIDLMSNRSSGQAFTWYFAPRF